MFSLFISDLHLASARPEINRVFHSFMTEIAPKAEALYVLGDLFEYWAGDDDLADPFNATICQELAGLKNSGAQLFVMHGNRDFLMAEKFANACSAKLFPDPTLVDLYGTPTLLMHGDTLCTDDVKYQAFRAQVRGERWQREFLAQPLSARKAAIEQLRETSVQETEEKTSMIMDVALPSVETSLRQYGYPRLIHGHTHRPAKHLHQLDGRDCERWVLNDWYQRGGYLHCDASGCRAVTL
jgi:UDP-2,3-diacylglucosamine hydrolase